MGPSATIQHVRHIAAQGLPSRMAVAAMVDALAEVVPTRTRTFIWANADGIPYDTYDRDLIPWAVDAFNQAGPVLAADPNAPSFDKMLYSKDEYGGWRHFQNMPGWERSALKNFIFVPYGIGNNLDFPLRGANGRPQAILTLGREPGTKAYSKREIDAVLSLRAHFLHAIDCQTALSAADARGVGDEVEIVLVGGDGAITAASPQGARMLYQLKLPTFTTPRFSCELAPDPVMEVVRRLVAAAEGLNPLPPSLEHDTPWGRFRLIAHTRSPAGEAVVSVQRLVPRSLRRLKRVSGFDLAPREREIALAMCGLGNGDAIALSVGMAVSSYREYARRIYARLGVDGRDGVRELLDS